MKALTQHEFELGMWSYDCGVANAEKNTAELVLNLLKSSDYTPEGFKQVMQEIVDEATETLKRLHS